MRPAALLEQRQTRVSFNHTKAPFAACYVIVSITMVMLFAQADELSQTRFCGVLSR